MIHVDVIHRTCATGSRADSTVNYLSRLIFYDGLTMAAQDGLSLDERVRASMAAEQLGLGEDLLVEELRLAALEPRLRRRLRLAARAHHRAKQALQQQHPSVS